MVETVERDEIHANLAEDNFLNEGRARQVRVLRGEAVTILPGLEGPYDLISVDTDWFEFPVLFNDILHLVQVGGIVISSNLFPRTFGIDLGGMSEVAEYRRLLETDDRLFTSYLMEGTALSFRR